MRQMLTLAAAAAAAVPALAHDAEMRHRLVVADAEAPVLHVLDVGSDAEPRTFELASPGRLNLGPDGRHAFVVQTEAGVVQALDTGLVEEDHGDHSARVLAEPALLPATVTGERPIHFNRGRSAEGAELVAVFWDGSGEATLHDAAAAAGGDLAPLRTLDTGGPHHGVAVPAGDAVIASLAPEGEGLPDVLAVLGPDGAEISRVECLNLHGEGKAGAFVAVGCEDGVAIFDTGMAPPEGRFVPYPEDAPEGMVRTMLSPRDAMALVASFGETGLAIIDPSAEDGGFAFAELPAPRVAFALDEAGFEGFAILADGRLVRFSALTGTIEGEAEGVTGAYSMESGVVRPMLAVAGERVAVSDPAAGEVALLDAGTLEVVERIAVGGTPRALLLLAAEAGHDH